MMAGGGTGGHVYPGLAVADLLRRGGVAPGAAPADIVWVGSTGGMERELVERAGLEFAAVHAGGLHGVGWAKMAINGAQLIRGTLEAVALVRRYRPAALFVTGGYASVPVALACRAAGVPGLVYLPDVEPGQAIRLLSRLTRKVAVTADASRAYFPHAQVVVTGYPVRPEFGTLARADARAALGLPAEAQVLLVVGGSRGAQGLNDIVVSNLEALLALAHVVHVTGTLDWDRVSAARARLDAAGQARYHAYAYLHELPAALVAADLAISRAGASTLGEFPAAGLPSILVPYPYAWRYQKVNADYLATRGAALRVDEADLAARVVALVSELLGAPARLEAMRAAASALAIPDAAGRLARELLGLVSPDRRPAMAGA